ncbi:hypothetical protein As57867_017091, partial [Aphanomyces stellatus]
MQNMQQLMEHLRKIEAGRPTDAKIIKRFQENTPSPKPSASDNDVNPNDIYTILAAERQPKPGASSRRGKKTAPSKRPPSIVPLETRRRRLHADMELLLRPPLPAMAVTLPAPTPSPPKPTQLEKQLALQQHHVADATHQVEAAMAEAEAFLPLSFLLERNMAALCQSKAGAIIQDAFQTFLLHFYTDAWTHWRAFVLASRAAQRHAAALVIMRVFRGHRARRACHVLRAQHAAYLAAKATVVAHFVAVRDQAALRIQMRFRRFKMDVRKADVAARHAAATKLQRLHMYNRQRTLALAKMLLDARRIHAALQIQRVWRGGRGRRRAKLRRVQVRHERLLRMLSTPSTAIAYRFET